MARHARALRPNRLFRYLHEYFLPLMQPLLDWPQMPILPSRLRYFAIVDRIGIDLLHIRLVLVVDVVDIEKRRFFLPNIDKRRLHARQHPQHSPLINVTRRASLATALQKELRNRAILDECHPRFVARRIHYQDIGHKTPKSQRTKMRPPPHFTLFTPFGHTYFLAP